ncbi:MAG: hypothetical protein AB7G20_09375 [Sulfurimonas sp.]|uniref:hypothetical protein n=1 Tax=Sulfurimonas sp. TaxID=2022749 RepID=UPI003D0F8846
MIGLLFFGALFGYIFLVKFAVNRIYEYTGEKIARNIALAIFILIPTWDIIIGYPIYKYLCWNNSGVHIYKTVDNVEGFYVGRGYGTPLDYIGYKYIEYKKRQRQNEPYKYYKVSWVDANTTEMCIQISNASSKYNLNLYQQGKCIVKEEITENEISRWEYKQNESTKKIIIPIVNIYEYKTVIKDRKTNQVIADNVKYVLDNNWFMGFVQNNISSRGSWSSCGNDMSMDMLRETLKIKTEER